MPNNENYTKRRITQTENPNCKAQSEENIRTIQEAEKFTRSKEIKT